MMKIYITLFFLILATANLFAYAEQIQAPPIMPPAGHPFPTVRIVTGTTAVDDNGYNPFGITRDEWRTFAQGVYISIENAWDSSYNFSNIPTDVRGRGNSTWWQYEGRKQPYRIRFPNPNTNHRSMLDSDYRARNWSFLANHSDRALIRNYAAHELGRMLGSFCFAPFVRNVHLYINGDYRGVYLLVDHMDNDGRVNINWDRNNPELSEYYLEFCRRRSGDHWFWAYDMPFEFREDSGITEGHYEVARAFMRRVYDAIYARDWELIQNLIEVPTFVDFYIVNELFKQIDINWSSVHMTIRGVGENRRLHKGPLWDFDRSAGDYCFWFLESNNNYAPFTPGEWVSAKDIPFNNPVRTCTENCMKAPSIAQRSVWYSYLFDIPEFRALVQERFYEVKQNHIPALIDFVRDMAQIHEKEFLRNHDRWGTNEVGTTPFMTRINRLLAYFVERTLWMEKFLSEDE